MLVPGVILDNRYRIIRTLSNKGGTAVVYEAKHLRLGRTVAVKETKYRQFDPDVRDLVLKAFQREAALLANLEHSVLPRVYDSFAKDDGHFLIMDFIPGPDLDEMLRERLATQGTAFPASEVVRWASRLLNALEYMHSHNEPVIHRDIKPANLKLTGRNEIILLDFGLAKGAVVGMQSITTIHGYTKQYAPLEQINGETTDCRSDLFSLGATLYHLLTGQLPPDAIKRVTNRNEGKPDPLKSILSLNPAVPPNVAAVIHRAMALYPQERPVTAQEIAIQLSDGKAVPGPRPDSADQEDLITLPKKRSSSSALSKMEELVPGPLAIENYQCPWIEMLELPAFRTGISETELQEFAQHVVRNLADLGVAGQVKSISSGPVVTTFEFKSAPGVKYSQVTGLAEELCLRLNTGAIRIDRIPTRSAIGIEIPNGKREIVRLREVIEQEEFRESESKLMLALGQTVDGKNFTIDLAKMPHLLIAGAAGAGKASALHSILLSLLFQASPSEINLILIDLKKRGFEAYAGLPHLVMPLVTEFEAGQLALNWVFSELEKRYQLMTSVGVRNIEQYNAEAVHQLKDHGAMPSGSLQPLPRLVIIINELEERMASAALEAKERVARLARNSRAAGIHLILSSTWPPAEGLADLIRATIPARICLRVSSKADSHTVIESTGAEGLLGRGDMLFWEPDALRPIRIQGAYVNETEIKRVCDFIRSQTKESVAQVANSSPATEARDEKYERAVRLVIEKQVASALLLQRELRISYGHALFILDKMGREGVISPGNDGKPPQVLINPDLHNHSNQIEEWKEGESTTRGRRLKVVLSSKSEKEPQKSQDKPMEGLRTANRYRMGEGSLERRDSFPPAVQRQNSQPLRPQASTAAPQVWRGRRTHLLPAGQQWSLLPGTVRGETALWKIGCSMAVMMMIVFVILLTLLLSKC
jgi:serine/threonine protein kinase